MLETPLATDQFVSDYTLVIDNDYDSYREVMDMPELLTGNMSGLSDKLKEQFETYISEVAEREREAGNEAGALLISQMLIGWGTHVFDRIARHYIDINLESRLVEHFTSVLKTETCDECGESHDTEDDIKVVS